MATIYDHIEQNKRRTWLLVLLFPLTFAALGYIFVMGYCHFQGATYHYDEQRDAYYRVYDEAAPSTITLTNQMALKVLPKLWLLAVIWVVISYYFGSAFLLRATRGIEIHREDQPEIYNLVENLCIAQGLPTPRIYIINDSSLNAFATGRDPYHASIALTKGLVQKLERAEVEGVVAHELAHIQNRDIRLMLISVLGISCFTFLAEICFRAGIHSSYSRGRNKGNSSFMFLLLGLFFAIYGYLIAPLIRLAVSRTREYQADATAALMTRHPAALASALQKISQDPRVEVLDAHASMAAMCIANPLAKQGLFSAISGLMATHPPIEKRIAALQEMDGRGSL